MALVARAFGANGLVLEGVCDPGLGATLERVTRCWGGPFHYECGVGGRSYVREWKRRGGQVVHLTMYGLPLHRVIDEIRMDPRPKLVVVGAEKVEGFYYEEADYNVAVGPQPHSEVAALAVFLDRLLPGWWAGVEYEGARMRVVPSPRGKRVEGEC